MFGMTINSIDWMFLYTNYYINVHHFSINTRPIQQNMHDAIEQQGRIQHVTAGADPDIATGEQIHGEHEYRAQAWTRGQVKIRSGRMVDGGSAEEITTIDKNIPFILQPVTSKNPVSSSLLFELMDFAGEKLKDVRAIPQTHKMMNLL